MKFIHLSDLHLGKRVNEFSMLEDQRCILEQVLELTDRERPDGVLLAGDVYDKAVPSAEAVALLDDFLAALAGQGRQVFLISGNHDSPERMAFGGRLMAGSGVHPAPVYNGKVIPFTLADEYGPVRIYLLPFVKPAQVRRFFPERELESYTDAVAAAVEAMGVDPSVRNVLVTHQFVTGAVRCDSEELSVGGTDSVALEVFDPFDYVALGHLHGPQQVGRATVRYCGSPLKYSFSEADQRKSVTVVELGEKGQVRVDTRPLVPLRDMVQLRGSFRELTDALPAEHLQRDYVRITLTDEGDIPDAVSRLRALYPNLMKLDYDNARTRAGCVAGAEEETRPASPLEVLEEFYLRQAGRPMEQAQRDFARQLMERIWEGETT